MLMLLAVIQVSSKVISKGFDYIPRNDAALNTKQSRHKGFSTREVNVLCIGNQGLVALQGMAFILRTQKINTKKIKNFVEVSVVGNCALLKLLSEAQIF